MGVKKKEKKNVPKEGEKKRKALRPGAGVGPRATQHLVSKALSSNEGGEGGREEGAERPSGSALEHQHPSPSRWGRREDRGGGGQRP